MVTVTGEIAVMLDVLGLPHGDGRILEAIARDTTERRTDPAPSFGKLHADHGLHRHGRTA